MVRICVCYFCLAVIVCSIFYGNWVQSEKLYVQRRVHITVSLDMITYYTSVTYSLELCNAIIVCGVSQFLPTKVKLVDWTL